MPKFNDTTPYWIKAIGEYGNSVLSHADNVFPESMAAYFPSVRPEIFRDPDVATIVQFTPAEQATTMGILGRMSDLIDMDFYKTTDPTIGTQQAIVFYRSDFTYASGLGLVGFPAVVGPDYAFPARAGGVWVNKIAVVEDLGRLMAHEIAHAMGLGHPEEGQWHLQTQDMQSQWTLMPIAGDSNTPGFVSTSDLRPLDIAAMQFQYGPSLKVRTGNDTYQLTETGPNFVWDGVGNNTMDASGAHQGATLYLTPGEWGHIGAKATYITAPGQVTVNFNSIIQNLTGTNFADTLHGTTGANKINGGGGNDTLHGLGGGDTFNGGAGIDMAVFGAARGAYTVSKGGAGSTITGKAGTSAAADGTNQLTQVERAKFADGNIALDMTGGGHGKMVARITGALYGGATSPTMTGPKSTCRRSTAAPTPPAAQIDALIGGKYGPLPNHAGLVNTLFLNIFRQLPGQTEKDVFVRGPDRCEFSRTQLVEYCAMLGATAELIGLPALQNAGWAYNEFHG